MKRRTFVKSIGALGVTASLPLVFSGESLIRKASAAPALGDVSFVAPPVMPQIINVFLYGGPSELAGNLTNIEDINGNSQNPYPEGLLRPSTEEGGKITRNGLWSDAGGTAMEAMLASGDMSIYRTVNRRKKNTRAHRPSIFSCLTGSLDIDNSPGMGTTLAAILYKNQEQLSRPLEEYILPFVSFEGESTAFLRNPNYPLPLDLQAVSLDRRFRNPYSRNGHDRFDEVLENLVSQMNAQSRSRFSKVFHGFETRRKLEALVDRFSEQLDDDALPLLPAGDVDARSDGRLRYPVNRYTSRIRAAATLAIANPETLFISVGGGIGGWDDHDSAIDRYTARMEELMVTLRAAVKHIKYASRPDGGSTGNIIINVFGDFGRNVNLNNSLGWDHGNNQNFYTLGGSDIRPAGALGKIVGRTERYGDSKQNRQYTRPVEGSYEFEPVAIAATMYAYFGVQNPEVLTGDTEYYPQGVSKIDETRPGEDPMFS